MLAARRVLLDLVGEHPQAVGALALLGQLRIVAGALGFRDDERRALDLPIDARNDAA